MKPERFTASIFILVVMGFMMMSLFMMASRKLIDTPMTPAVKAVHINWESLYPFEEGSKETQEKLLSFYDYAKERIEEYTSSKLPGYYRMTEAAKKYEDIAGWNMVSVFDYNAVFRLKDGYLTNYTRSRDITADAESVKDFADFCAAAGTSFMYINIPVKVCVSEDKEISGVLDFANQNADKFLATLKESGVRYYDFRKNLHESGMTHHGAFYVTDHHWKTETGLWAAFEVLKILRDDFAWNIEPEILRPENFEYVIYHDWFLGARGRKLTLSRAKPEDFTMIYPKFETLIRFEAADINMNDEGDFSVIYDMNEVKEKDFYGKEPYAAYIHKNRSLTRIENKLITNGKRVLVLKDSFANCVVPFIALAVQYVDIIDLRLFTGSVRSFIESEKPNAVIVMYPSNTPGGGHPSYDFR